MGYYHQIHAHEHYPAYLIDTGAKRRLAGNARVYAGEPLRGPYPAANPNSGEPLSYGPQVIFEETLEFVRANAGRRFFCYAAWTPPHGRYEIPADDPAWRRYAGRDWPLNARVAAAMVTMADRHVGELMALLEELGLERDTLVLVGSDHGAAERFGGSLNSCGPLRGRKRSMYEGGLRTPMVARWPGRVPAGAVSDLPWYFPDLLPTLAELAGAAERVPGGVDGVSIAGELLGAELELAERALYWEYPHYDWGAGAYDPDRLGQAVMAGRFKLLRPGRTSHWELYDVVADPGEARDLASDREALAEGLAALAQAMRVDPPPQVEPPRVDGRRYR